MRNIALSLIATVSLGAFAVTGEYEGLEVITSVDGGKVTTYSRSADVYYDDFGDLVQAKNEGACAEIVILDNGDAYVKNPISTYNTESYIKGKLTGNTIRCEFPQKLYHNYNPVYGIDENYYIHRLVFKNKGTELVYELPEDGGDYIEFTINDDGTVSMEKTAIDEKTGCPLFVIGMTVFEEEVGEGWFGFADWNQEYTQFTDTLVEVPEDLSFESWRMDFWQELGKWNQDGRFIDIAFDEANNDVYLRNFYYAFPGVAIKGKMEDGKITFPSGQYIGIDANTNHYAYFMGCRLDASQNSDGSLVPYLVREDALVFDYDKDEKTLITESWFNLNSGNSEDLFSIFYYGEPTIRYQEPFEPANPKDPQFFIGPTFDDGSGYWLVKIPKTDVNNHLLNTDQMYYTIFLDDEPFEFFADETPGLEQDTYKMPYNFANGEHFLINGELHQIPYMSFIGYSEVYCQSVYVAPDGTEYKSNKIKNLTSVEELGSEKELADDICYDLQGRRISRPQNGLVIREKIFTDGTRSVVKEIIK